MTAPVVTTCAYQRVASVTADQLEGDDQGALEPDEIGFIAFCRCGHQSRVRYSPVAAQSEIAEHILGGINEAAS